jgi:hypothetical protein
MNTQYALQGEVYCYQVANFDKAYLSDEDVITKLETRLVEAGGVPAKIDFPSQLCCVEIIEERVDLDSLAQIFKSLGLDIVPLGLS